MISRWPCVFTDSNGAEESVIEYEHAGDPFGLSLLVRGITLRGTWAYLDVDDDFPEAELDRRGWHRHAGGGIGIYSYTLAAQVPCELLDHGQVAKAQLNVSFAVSPELDKYGGFAGPLLTLDYLGARYQSDHKLLYGGSFEAALLRITRALPEGLWFHSCFGCAFLSYNPRGDNEWCGRCYRNHKQEYTNPSADIKNFAMYTDAAQGVDEMYVCPEFERWNGQTGYRDRLTPLR